MNLKKFLNVLCVISLLSISSNCFALDGASTDFNGSTSIVSVESCSDFNNVNTFTWCIWENHDGDGENANGRLINKNTSGGKLWFMTGASWEFQVATSGTDAVSNTATGQVGTNTWRFGCSTYDDDGDRKIRMYKNGIEVTYDEQTAATGTVNANTTVFTFGNHTTDIRTFDGQLLHPHIYNRVISTDEMIELKQRPCSILDGLLGCWDSTMTINLAASCGTATHTATTPSADAPDVQLTTGAN